MAGPSPSPSPTPPSAAPAPAPKGPDYQATLAQEWESFKTPAAQEVAVPPKVGDKAPVHENLKLPTDKPTIIVFLRHCGCPFAEKVFRQLTHYSTQHPNVYFVAVSHSSPEATERWVIQVGGNWDVEVVIDEERELYARWGLGVATTWHVLSPLVLYRTLQLGKQENIWNRPTESGSRWQTAGAFALTPNPTPAVVVTGEGENENDDGNRGNGTDAAADTAATAADTAATAADTAATAADTAAAATAAGDGGGDGGIVRWAHVASTADDLPDLVQALASLGVKARPWPPRPVESRDY